MRNCATCQHWHRADTARGPRGKCLAILHDAHGAGNLDPEDVAYIRRVATERPGADDWDRERWAEVKRFSAVPALCRDASGYAASVETLPTFGCTMHTPREGPADA